MFSKTSFQIISIIVLIVIFWYPIMFENEFFYDDWAFISTFKAGTPSLGYFLQPHNEHFMPMFKMIFFAMYKLFQANIMPYMALSIVMHIINCLLLFVLLRLIFKGKKLLSYLLTLFFALNVTYFEVLHWFVNLSQALMLMFLIITLVLMHRSVDEDNKKLYYWSLFTSFFIPMNFSMGFLGIFFVVTYYFLILKGKLLDGIRFLAPYLYVWALYLVTFLTFSLYSIMHKPATAPKLTFDATKLVFYFVLGFVGLFIRNLGYSMLVFPYTTGLAVLFTIIFVVFLFFLLFYYILNPAKQRKPLLWGSGIIAFSLMGIFVCYAILAVGRSSLEPFSFISWGRYHYLPMFFFTILLGAVAPRFFGIFSGIFNEKRLKALVILLFIGMLMTHFVLIRQKSFSPVRTEGLIPVKVSIS